MRALPRKKSSRERRSRREPEKNGHFGTLTTHFLRETSTHIFMRVPAAAPQRLVRGTYLPTALLTVYRCTDCTSAAHRPPFNFLRPRACPTCWAELFNMLSYNVSITHSVERLVSILAISTKIVLFLSRASPARRLSRERRSRREPEENLPFVHVYNDFLEKHQHTL